MKTSCKTLDNVLDNKMSVLLARKNKGFISPPHWILQGFLHPSFSLEHIPQHESPGQSSYLPHPNILTLSSSQPPVFLFTTHSFWGPTQSSHLCDFPWFLSDLILMYSLSVSYFFWQSTHSLVILSNIFCVILYISCVWYPCRGGSGRRI